jgi:hypothetical protein
MLKRIKVRKFACEREEILEKNRQKKEEVIHSSAKENWEKR